MTIRIAANAARVGYRETRSQYTWRSWLFGWVLRLVAQTLFFAAMGILVGSDDLIEFALIGNVAAGVTLMVLGIGPDTAWERSQGTLPLLIAAPRSLLPVFAGRNVFHLVQGVGEGLVIFVLVAPWVGVEGNYLWLPPALMAIALGSYGLGLFIAAFAIRKPRWGNTIYNLVYWTTVAIGGVNVSRTVFPHWVQQVGSFLPLVHGLTGLRELLSNGFTGAAVGQLGLELAVGAAWFTVALAGFALFSQGGRKDGTIDLVE
ncbi:MAG: ABC transporter permease [Actinobacteria bacterium]|nr:ABC transporter permease [Actinomycetota bacterium]